MCVHVSVSVCICSEGSVVATVNNVFQTSSSATEQSVNQTINNAIKNGIIGDAAFTRKFSSGTADLNITCVYIMESHCVQFSATQ